MDVIWEPFGKILRILKTVFMLIVDSLVSELLGGVALQNLLQRFDHVAGEGGDNLGLIVVDMDEACVSTTLLE